jgi:CHAT domain-containing protein
VWSVIDASSDELVEAALRRGLDPTETPLAAAGKQQAGGFDLARAHALYKLVLGPVAGVLAGKQHLLLVPTGPLSSLPFQVLVTEPPPAGAQAGAPWLIRRHALSVLPSVPSLAALRLLAPPGRPAKPFLGIGDPTLTGPPPGTRQSRGSPRPSSVYRSGQGSGQAGGGAMADVQAVRELTPLPESADELRRVASALGASNDAVYLRGDATETNVKRTRLEDYRVIQFATHGLVAGDLSGLAEPALVLTPPAAPSDLDDGLLTASEVAGLRLTAEWVVLSACNTASGTDSGAEALSGLARAFFYAGARGLLVSHWSVNSLAAVELTTATFSKLAANPQLGRAEAFRRTMLDMIDAGKPPSHWAPFIIVGEGAAR